MVLVSYFSDLKQIVYEFFSLNLNIFIFQKKKPPRAKLAQSMVG